MVPSAAADSEASGPPVVLLVEDDVVIRAATAAHLRGLGYETLEAVDFDQAVALLKARSDIGVVFSDIKLPGDKSGFDLLAVVERDFPAVRMLFTSGVIKAEEASHRGITFLRKPYFLFEVERQIRALLEA